MRRKIAVIFAKKNIQQVKFGPCYTEFRAWRKSAFKSTFVEKFIKFNFLWAVGPIFYFKIEFPAVFSIFGHDHLGWGAQVLDGQKFRPKTWCATAAKAGQDRTWKYSKGAATVVLVAVLNLVPIQQAAVERARQSSHSNRIACVAPSCFKLLN